MIRTPLPVIAAVFSVLMAAGAGYAADVPPVLADPTQPPASVLGPDGLPVADGGSSGLTSVMLPKKGGRPTAIIDGRVVTVGEMVGMARLVRLTETEALLEGPEGVERLYLTPSVEKKMNVTKGAVRRQKDKP
jgi:MSHA biogenesis protein MshK